MFWSPYLKQKAQRLD